MKAVSLAGEGVGADPRGRAPVLTLFFAPKSHAADQSDAIFRRPWTAKWHAHVLDNCDFCLFLCWIWEKATACGYWVCPHLFSASCPNRSPSRILFVPRFCSSHLSWGQLNIKELPLPSAGGWELATSMCRHCPLLSQHFWGLSGLSMPQVWSRNQITLVFPHSVLFFHVRQCHLVDKGLLIKGLALLRDWLCIASRTKRVLSGTQIWIIGINSFFIPCLSTIPPFSRKHSPQRCFPNHP